MEKRPNMKKWLLYTAFLLISMLTGTSCVMDNDDLPDCPPPPIDKEAPVVTAGLYCNDKLIAWGEENSIGVFLIDNEKETLLQDSLGAPYILNEAEKGIFIPQWGISNQVIERPPLNVVYDALGIFPYGNVLKNTQSVSLSIADQSRPDKLDIFIPRRVHNVTAETDTIHLDFYRRMSRLLFNLSMTEVSADQTEVKSDEKLSGAAIWVNGFPINGTFALDNDKVETNDIQSFEAYMTENGKQGQAIVFPSVSTKDVRIQVSLPQYPDTIYSFVLNDDILLEACHSYELSLDMKYIYKPEIKKYRIKYRYEGKANSQNVEVTRTSSKLPWGEGDIIILDENNDFTFQYQSNLKVSVRTEDGETLPMTSGKPYTFEQIRKDITIIIYAEEEKPEPDPDPEPEKTYKVTYRYTGEANSSNVKVYKNDMNTEWAQTETITVKENEHFTFGFRSDMIVSVKTNEGENLIMNSGSPYTFTKINKDIEIIINAETPEYAVKYAFVGDYTDRLVTVEKKAQNTFNSWGKTETVWVREGNDFTFKATGEVNVTVKVGDKTLRPNTDGSYTLENIYEDIIVVISTNVHKVIYQYEPDGSANKDNVSVYKNEALTETWKEKTEIIWVEDGNDFVFGTDSHYELIVTDNHGPLTPIKVSGSITQNTFKIKNITKDMVVIITAEIEEDLVNHKVIYMLMNAAKGNTTVMTEGASWAEDVAGVKTVSDGSNFSFTATGNYTLTVTALYPNDPKNLVTVKTNGDNYTIENIKKNVLIFISATTHTVDYTFTGNKYIIDNKVSIPILGDAKTWNEKETITVDNNGKVTIKNNSNFTIIVSGWGDEAFSLSPRSSQELADITKDIHLEIKADIVKVTYVLDDTDAGWLEIKQNNQNWNAGDANAKYMDKNTDFAFNCRPKAENVAIEYVREKNDGDISGLAYKYTLAKTDADKEIHIKAVKTYKVTYEITAAAGTNVPTDFQVFKDQNGNSWTAGTGGELIKHAGSSFTFGYPSEYIKDYTITVEKKVNSQKEPITMTAEGTYTENINNDTHYIIHLAKKPVVTVNYDKDIEIKGLEGGPVDYSSSKEFTATVNDPKWEITVTIKENGNAKEEKLEPTNGKYIVENITKDTTINLTKHRKPADMPINADIHIWEELPPINGGIIYPKTN